MSETFPYEQLDGARFQRLAQALIVREYPNVQCLPVSGADGGRDAISMAAQGERFADSIVFQVKFKEQQPLGVPTSAALYNWITGELAAEAAKVASLKERELRHYVVITNIKASGNDDVGLRDRVTAWAREQIAVPTTFWWRDDLDTRLAGNYDLIFRFSLFTGPESVRAVLQARYEDRIDIGGPILRNTTHNTVLALTSYIADQYRIESSLRFEQADITSTPLIDLFVDVPMQYAGRRQHASIVHWIWTNERQSAAVNVEPDEENIYLADGDETADFYYLQGTTATGAANLLLSQDIPGRASHIVIEGAPGQGKSTLGQYICQVHRIRILNITADLQRLPDEHRKAPVRIPIRVELRHLASWFAGVNPWSSDSVADEAAVGGSPTKSLESFIAGHIRHASGGMSFTPDDIVSILSRTPTLLVLDGLDEVADIQLRRQIVDGAEASIARLESLGADLQVIVTSRPAIFVKAPGFSREGFAYFHLSSLTAPIIRDYAHAWLEVRAFPDEKRTDILSILESSVKQGHVAELARNPMQLAILLWLISIKGRALPDQRTSLYEQYMMAFLDREAQKSPSVLTHRRRLMEIHGYLGWLLHSRAESHTARYAGGDIGEAELRSVVTQYLVREQRPTGLVDELFAGAERIFALVSRVEGRYEFEVQPLREFFAGRYLYKTAPPSIAGAPSAGSRTDRLHYLLQNPYWLNVARFFCGWYDKGELADLTRQIRDLCNDPAYKRLSYPRLLIAAILQDCTTAESQRDSRELVDLMTDELGLRILTGRGALGTALGGSDSPWLLTADGGLEFFTEHLRTAYLAAAIDEQRWSLSVALRTNDDPDDLARWWLKLRPPSGDDGQVLDWLRRGEELGALSYIPLEEALGIFDAATSTFDQWVKCVESGRFDVGQHDPDRFSRLSEIVGFGIGRMSRNVPRGGEISLLPDVFGEARLFRARRRVGFETFTGDKGPIDTVGITPEWAEPLSHLLRIGLRVEGLTGLGEVFEGFEEMCDGAQEAFGESWLAWRTALIAGTLPLRLRGAPASFGDRGVNLARRARAARVSSRNEDYWLDATNLAPQTVGCTMALSTAVLTWADYSLLPLILPRIAAWWSDLGPHDVRRIVGFSRVLRRHSGTGSSAPRRIPEQLIAELATLPATLTGALNDRTDATGRELIFARVSQQVNDDGQLLTDAHGDLTASIVLAGAYEKLTKRSATPAVLRAVRRFYLAARHGSIIDITEHDPFEPERILARGNLTETILEAPREFPYVLVRGADLVSYSKMASKLRPLREIAREQDWFPGLSD